MWTFSTTEGSLGACRERWRRQPRSILRAREPPTVHGGVGNRRVERHWARRLMPGAGPVPVAGGSSAASSSSRLSSAIAARPWPSIYIEHWSINVAEKAIHSDGHDRCVVGISKPLCGTMSTLMRQPWNMRYSLNRRSEQAPNAKVFPERHLRGSSQVIFTFGTKLSKTAAVVGGGRADGERPSASDKH
jgi:hypothetical protein